MVLLWHPQTSRGLRTNRKTNARAARAQPWTTARARRPRSRQAWPTRPQPRGKAMSGWRPRPTPLPGEFLATPLLWQVRPSVRFCTLSLIDDGPHIYNRKTFWKVPTERHSFLRSMVNRRPPTSAAAISDLSLVKF
eukprot:scaffold37566_cov14-Prasinocladus_malaysianus.AAC.1